MGKEVKMLAIFDTDADNAREREPWYKIQPKVFKRYLPKFLGGKKSMTEQIAAKLRDKANALKDKAGLAPKAESAEYFAMLDSVIVRYFEALKNYKLEPVTHNIYLFKADFNDHYNDDEIYLGWKKYTSKEVKRYLVPGNHLTMMMPPNVPELGKAVQDALNNC
jgi:thioesterase domain-containing protein